MWLRLSHKDKAVGNCKKNMVRIGVALKAKNKGKPVGNYLERDGAYERCGRSSQTKTKWENYWERAETQTEHS